jgi:hypothetical protein
LAVDTEPVSYDKLVVISISLTAASLPRCGPFLLTSYVSVLYEFEKHVAVWLLLPHHMVSWL